MWNKSKSLIPSQMMAAMAVDTENTTRYPAGIAGVATTHELKTHSCNSAFGGIVVVGLKLDSDMMNS